eukprot:gnl/TRDRNA2_/TRDRNA2_127035_c1_seq1.p1 gnl/TRDRNA2_/TRDRNA2_127035_c1~~gnl/TRDRNA2_/TRDRNA2_127035_c1_seq1.p1  ORF type:complete len:278 (+),score=45.38 gnl/TRDRNA2_/TRDRNA2_127035_c1_seq1:27-836(+)
MEEDDMEKTMRELRQETGDASGPGINDPNTPSIQETTRKVRQAAEQISGPVIYEVNDDSIEKTIKQELVGTADNQTSAPTKYEPVESIEQAMDKFRQMKQAPQPASRPVRHEPKEPVDYPDAWVCFPCVGRHVAFAGAFLHGVPAYINPAATAESGDAKRQKHGRADRSRLSVFVNVWLDRKPDEIEELPAEALSNLSIGLGAFRLNSDADAERYESHIPIDIDVGEIHTARFEDDLIDNPAAFLPADQLCNAAAMSPLPPLLRLHYCR